jgi:hypothetical protein
MNSTSSSYWQEQQLMDAMVAGLKKNRGKLQSSTDSENGGSAMSATSSEGSDDRVRNWLDVRAAALCLFVSRGRGRALSALCPVCIARPRAWLTAVLCVQQQLGEDAAEEYARWKEEKRVAFSKNLRTMYGLPPQLTPR